MLIVDTPATIGQRLTWSAGYLTSYDEKKGSLLRALLSKRDERKVAELEDSTLVSSRSRDGLHRPVIDLDVPHSLVPSSTEGHAHLYIDVAMPWWRYVILLFALRQAGVIERGFLWWSLQRGATFARLPGVCK